MVDMHEEFSTEAASSDLKRNIEARIVHVLRIYPKLSMSMLQVGIGTNTPAVAWKPVLEEMILKGWVDRSSIWKPGPNGRTQQYQILQLTDEYTNQQME